MKCFHEHCVCSTCEKLKTGECWRKEDCRKKNLHGYCRGYVSECSALKLAEKEESTNA